MAGEGEGRAAGGETFAGHHLVRRLDGGGDFAFYLAASERGDARVVLCVEHDVAQWAFLPWQDPAIATRLRHPAIVELLAEGTTDRHRYFVFECAAGPDLRELARAGPAPPAAALAVARSLADALAYAHEGARAADGSPLAFVHGRVAPRHVFVSPRGAVKLGGFGFASLKPERPKGPDAAPHFDESLAPELLRGEPSEPSADLFGLGYVLHQMLFGAPFVSRAYARFRAVLEACTDAPPAPPPDAGPHLEPLLRSLLAERPEDRPASAAAARDAIDLAIDRLGLRDATRAAAGAWVARALGR